MKHASESPMAVWDEARPLLEKDQDEVGFLPLEFLNPDRELYDLLEKRGAVKVFTCRTVDGELVGYNVFFIGPHPHYRGMVWATQDALWVDKRYRGLQAVRFLMWCDKELRRLGVDAIVRQVTMSVDYSGSLQRMGYKSHEIAMIRLLTPNSEDVRVSPGG